MAQVINPKHGSWRDLHQAALKEADPKKLHGLILALEEAMYLRAQQLGDSEAHQKERDAINEAAEKLLAIKTEKMGCPGIAKKNSDGD